MIGSKYIPAYAAMNFRLKLLLGVSVVAASFTIVTEEVSEGMRCCVAPLQHHGDCAAATARFCLPSTASLPLSRRDGLQRLMEKGREHADADHARREAADAALRAAKGGQLR